MTNDTGADLLLNSLSIDFGTVPDSSFFDVDFTDSFLNMGLVLPVSGYDGPLFFVKWHNVDRPRVPH